MAREKNKPQGNKSLGRSQFCGEVPVPQRKAVPQDRLQFWQRKGGGAKDPLSLGANIQVTHFANLSMVCLLLY